MLGVLPPDSKHLGPIIEMLHDPKQLWSPYGIRSLSASHPEFGQGENYWKGPIWIQMNYLVLKALHEVSICSSIRGTQVIDGYILLDICGTRRAVPRQGKGALS
jgi:glycogen debranching enzyme